MLLAAFADVLPPGFHHVYAATVAVTVVVVCAWAARRIPAKRAERARLERLLAELEER